MSELYDSLDDAIYYAAQAAYDRGEIDNKEWMTLVYGTPEGKYSYLPHQGGVSETETGGVFRKPKGSVLQALVHNHPKDRNGRWLTGQDMFSDDDISNARQTKLPSVIAFGEDMQLALHDPRRSAGRHGQPFTHIPEVKPAGQRIEPRPEHLISALRGGAQ